MRSPTAGQRGFALLMVLWSLALLALLGSTITAAGRSESRIAANLLAAANAQAGADSAISVAAFHLLDSSPQHWDADGVAHRLRIGQADVELQLIDQRGKIDPNDSPPGLIAALLRDMGTDDATATGVANAITDWRSVNDSGLGPAYVAQGYRYGPAHESMQSLDELQLVLGVTPAIYAALRPHLSLYIEQNPDLPHADPQVRQAVADAVKRGQLTINDGEGEGPLIVSVVATGHVGRAVFTRIALLRMNGIAEQPYEILEWD